MRKVSVKNTSKSKSKQPPQTTSSIHFIQTETGTRNKSTHRHKHRSELHSIHELPFGIIKKNSGKQSGHSRKLSKISEKSNARDSNIKTFRQGCEDYNPTSTQDFDFLQIETNGLDGILSSRNKPQLPTNFAQLSCLKSKNTNPSISIQQDPKKVAPQKQWNEKKIPYPPKEVIKQFSHLLSQVEKQEIQGYPNVYFIAHKNDKKFSPNIFDNEEHQYVFTLNDHIEYRYEILRFLGKGSYGQVFRVLDHKTKKELAVKMIKNKKKFTKQAQIEINILNTIKKLDPNGYSGIVEIQDSFIFRKHQCIVFELLHDNLYQVIRNNNFVGLNLQLIKRFSIQILNSLYFLKENSIIHCDLKPENILLVEPNKARIKLIDLGSSCLSHEILYEYIQSRYYRAPQITLGIPYDQKIDMWSFACVLVELYTGMPLFPGNTEQEQVGYMIQSLGMPDDEILKMAKRKKVFFDQNGLKPELVRKGNGSSGKKLKQIIYDQPFLSFIEKILRWNPEERLTPKQALQHQWIVDGLPNQIRNLNLLFKQKSSSKPKQLKQNKPKTKLIPRNGQKSARPPLRSASNARQNKSVPSKDLKSKPGTARKENPFCSIRKQPLLSVQK